jgi:hypothetical protein
MKIQDINRLMFNPIWIGTLLHFFLSGVTESKNKNIKFELIYLALPFLFDEKLKTKLALSNTRSTFYSLFNEIELKNHLVGMDKKITDFTGTTNKALVMLGDKIIITDGGYIHTQDCVNYQKIEDTFRDYCKAAYNLGAILAKENYGEIFLKIGAVT